MATLMESTGEDTISKDLKGFEGGIVSDEAGTINKLKSALETLQAECNSLKSRLDGSQSLYEDERAENEELKKSRLALSSEIMDLTKALFEEANGMVAEEAKARAKLELTRRKLEGELEATKEHLLLEKQQLFELRDRFSRENDLWTRHAYHLTRITWRISWSMTGIVINTFLSSSLNSVPIHEPKVKAYQDKFGITFLVALGLRICEIFQSL